MRIRNCIDTAKVCKICGYLEKKNMPYKYGKYGDRVIWCRKCKKRVESKHAHG